MSGRVIAVGSVNVDLVASVPRLPDAGETVSGAAFAQHDGGKGGNQAVAAARLGAQAVFIGAIGDDAFGERARAAFAGEGVDLSAVVVHPGEPTGVALILVQPDGENLIAVAPGANATLSVAEVATALAAAGITSGDVVLVSHEIPTAAVRAALAAGRAAGSTTMLNPAPAVGLDRGVLGLADIVTPNRPELTVLARAEARRTGRPDPGGDGPEKQARLLLDASAEGSGPRVGIVVTLGAAGALLVGADQKRFAEITAPAVHSVDATGAGDAFAGALAAGLAEGRPLEEAARRAVVAASLATTKVGAREGMPTRAEVDAALVRPSPAPAS